MELLPKALVREYMCLCVCVLCVVCCVLCVVCCVLCVVCVLCVCV